MSNEEMTQFQDLVRELAARCGEADDAFEVASQFVDSKIYLRHGWDRIEKVDYDHGPEYYSLLGMILEGIVHADQENDWPAGAAFRIATEQLNNYRESSGWVDESEPGTRRYAEIDMGRTFAVFLLEYAVQRRLGAR